MVSPGDPDQAARLAKRAAAVSHDGEAVHGAVALAVMEAMAFVERDTNRLLDKALAYIPADSVIAGMIGDIRQMASGGTRLACGPGNAVRSIRLRYLRRQLSYRTKPRLDHSGSAVWERRLSPKR